MITSQTHRAGRLAALALLAVTAACSPSAARPSPTEPAVSIEKRGSAQPSRITLSARAAERLGIETAAVAPAASGSDATVVPYAAVFYDAKGQAWAYTNPSQLQFIRVALTVDRVEGQAVIVSAGPTAGTRVVTVGAAELYGAETGVGGGH